MAVAVTTVTLLSLAQNEGRVKARDSVQRIRRRRAVAGVMVLFREGIPPSNTNPLLRLFPQPESEVTTRATHTGAHGSRKGRFT